MNNNPLFSLIIKIASEENGQPMNNEFKQKLQYIMKNNALEHEHSVPQWLIELFSQVANKQSTSILKFSYKDDNTGDVFNFIAELEDVMGKQWIDTGEDVELNFDRMKVYAHISLESKTYYVKHYGNNMVA